MLPYFRFNTTHSYLCNNKHKQRSCHSPSSIIQVPSSLSCIIYNIRIEQSSSIRGKLLIYIQNRVLKALEHHTPRSLTSQLFVRKGNTFSHFPVSRWTHCSFLCDPRRQNVSGASFKKMKDCVPFILKKFLTISCSDEWLIFVFFLKSELN